MQPIELFGAPGRATRLARDGGAVELTHLCGVPLCAAFESRGPFGTQGLAVVTLNGKRFEGERLVLERCDVTEGRLDLVWRVGDSSVVLRSVLRSDSASGIVRRSDAIVNQGRVSVLLERALGRVALPRGEWECYSQASRWCRENQGAWQSLHTNLALRHASGRTTQGGTPYLALRPCLGSSADLRPLATPATRPAVYSGIVFHVLPRGNWVIHLRRITEGGDVPYAVVELGLSDENLSRAIAPGETFELPELLFQPLAGGDPAAAAPELHRYLDTTFFSGAKEAAPVVYNTWFDQFEVLDVPRLRAQLVAAKDVGCETFVIDAGWYGAGGPNWSAQTGDWREKTDDAFRGRMQEFADEVRAAGLGFGLWMEPERFGPEAPIRSEHPEWFVPVGAMARIDLSQGNAREWLRGEIARLVETYRLAWMKVDFNFALDDDGSGAELADYTDAWFALLDEMRASYPQTFFEGCSSGALRGDLETLRHFDGHFLSDSVDPIDAIRISQGAWLRLPPGRLTKWVVLRSAGQAVPEYRKRVAESSPTILAPTGAVWEPSSTADIDFVLLSAMTGMLGFSGDLAGLAPDHRSIVARGISFYKTWRRFITRAEAHLLTSIEPVSAREGWVAVQLKAAQLKGTEDNNEPGTKGTEDDTSLVFVYRCGNTGAPPSLRLCGLSPSASYRIQNGFSDEQTDIVVDGDRLMIEGLPPRLITIAPHHAAVLVVTRG
jgi:alpha-galactosidase